MENHNFSEIQVPRFPVLKPLPNGRWQRVWNIEFEKAIDSDLLLPSISSEIGSAIRILMNKLFVSKYPDLEAVNETDFILTLQRANSRSINATTETGRYTRTDEFWIIAPTYLIVLLARHIGEIRFIEEEPKESYFLWRGRKMFLGDSC